MDADHIKAMDLEDYLQLKKQVNNLYTVMMDMHAKGQRDVAYANARAAYMEQRNLLQRVLENHPQFEPGLPSE